MSGTADQAKGRIKQAAGALADDDRLSREGERDESAGKLKDKLDDVKGKADELIDRAKDKINSRDN